MVSLKTSALLAQALLGCSHALDLRWAAEGGNKTDPLQYGIMYEVRSACPASLGDLRSHLALGHQFLW